MLTAEANERLTRVGPGTPCGELMRRYWIPIAPFAQLLENPVRPVRVLGEDLVLYRDRRGQLGVIGDRCLHRSVHLKLGIPDDDGLRCPYHGWLYGCTGRVLDTPLEAAESTFKDRLRMKAYPARELGGLVWTYMGPEPTPALPPWDPFVWPNAVRQIGVCVLNCNWLQCQENTGDPTHSVYLHGHWFRYILERQGLLEDRAADPSVHTIYSRIRMGDGIAGVYAHPTAYGFEKGIEYSKALGAGEDRRSRHSTVIFPFYTRTGSPGSPRSEVQIRVPIDDTHTYHINYGVYAAPPGIEAPAQDSIPWYEVPMFDEQGEPLLDFVLAQDMAVWWAQGEVADRTQEKLGRTDIPIILMRRQLEQQIRVVEDGGTPMNVFADQSAPGDMLYMVTDPDEFAAGHPVFADAEDNRGEGTYRARYHRGYIIDDADRYGPAVSLVQELHRRIEEARNRRA
jgi:5,5'-dehydrodivanillate O-demethylase